MWSEKAKQLKQDDLQKLLQKTLNHKYYESISIRYKIKTNHVEVVIYDDNLLIVAIPTLADIKTPQYYGFNGLIPFYDETLENDIMYSKYDEIRYVYIGYQFLKEEFNFNMIEILDGNFYFDREFVSKQIIPPIEFTYKQILTPEQKLKKREYKRIWEQKKMANDPLYMLQKRCRRRTYGIFNEMKLNKVTPTKDLLGAEWEIVKEHIEKQFRYGMNWDNTEIDHIIQLSSDNSEEDTIKLCHYLNLQPLPSVINRKKHKHLWTPEYTEQKLIEWYEEQKLLI